MWGRRRRKSEAQVSRTIVNNKRRSLSTVVTIGVRCCNGGKRRCRKTSKTHTSTIWLTNFDILETGNNGEPVTWHVAREIVHRGCAKLSSIHSGCVYILSLRRYLDLTTVCVIFTLGRLNLLSYNHVCHTNSFFMNCLGNILLWGVIRVLQDSHQLHYPNQWYILAGWKSGMMDVRLIQSSSAYCDYRCSGVNTSIQNTLFQINIMKVFIYIYILLDKCNG